MVREDGKRNFALRESDGTETSVFSGQTPRQAALKAARRLEAHDHEDEAREGATELVLRERGTDRLHVYEGWAWREEADDGKPDFLGDEYTEANVTKVGVRHDE